MELELRHLKVVCAIAELGSVTKAASALGLAQPALTAQLQRIERTLGGALFERDRRGARPTPLGELVLARARVVLPAVDGLRDEAARLAGTDCTQRRYRIGTVGGPILGGLVDRLVADQPDAQVTTYTSFYADELSAMVLAGKLDFALVGVCGDAAPPAAGLVWHAIGVEAVSVLLPEAHPLAQPNPLGGVTEVDLADLAEANWVAAPGDGCFGQCFAKACARAGFTPRRFNDIDVFGAFDLVEAGRAVALCKPTLRMVPGVVPVPLAGAPLRWRQLIGWHPEAQAAGLGPRLAWYAEQAHADAVRKSTRYAAWLRGNPQFGAGSLAA
jgi:DNA-binding transcriptional LysR family regulator